MNLKKISIACIVGGIVAFLISGALYVLGGHELFTEQDSYNHTTENKTIETKETIETEETIEDIETIKMNINEGGNLINISSEMGNIELNH